MRFIHTSDWHIGASKFIPDNLERQAEAIDQIFAIAKDRNITTVVVAGDIFDTDQPSREERDLAQRKLIGYDNAGFNILVIPGNHDMSDMTGYTAIHYLHLLYEGGKFLNSTITEKTTYRIIDDTLFILLCHTPRHFKADCLASVEGVLSASIKPKYKKVVLVAHETIKGSLTDTNFRLKGGEAAPLDYGEEIQSDEITYVALGDIHIKQKMGPRTYYCGAPLQVKFGDQWPKGVFIVDTDDPDNPEFVPVASKRMVKVTDVDNIPEDCYVKLITNKIDSSGLNLPANVIKSQFVKAEMDPLLEVNNEITLHQQVLTELTKNIPDAVDLALAKRELEDIFQKINVDG